MRGFPQFNADGTPFDKKCYSKVVKQTRHAATEIAKTLKLTSFQNAYDANNEEILEDEPPRVDLLQSYNPASRASSSNQADPDHIFESLVSVTWKNNTEEGPAQDQVRDPATIRDTSTRLTGPTQPATEWFFLL